MATAKGKNRQPTVADEYWQKLKQDVTSTALFIDAAAILDCYDPKYQETVQDFLTNEAVNYRYITSTYVVCETVRRLASPKGHYPFIGPNNEKHADLAL